MLIPSAPPSEDALLGELAKVRDDGLPRLRHLDLPALASAARIVTLDETSADHVIVEALLRRAVARLGGGHYGEAAVALLGLDTGTRGLNSKARREIAAEAFERTYETFRKNYEPLLFEQFAAQILVLCSEQHTRDTRSALERAESPEKSAMPQVWMDRFAAYYRIWSPVYALGADLTAYRATLLEPDEVWDRRFGTNAPDDPGYSKDEQAEGYATFALFHYAHFEWELRQFQTLYGGQWLLSDAKTEQAVADAVYRIGWHAPWNERDQSYLRTLVSETPGREMHGFIQLLRAPDLGRTTEQEWQEWTTTCRCAWPPGSGTEQEYFPTSHHHDGILNDCEVHNVVNACGDYLDLIDQDWKRLADWYHLNDAHRRGVNPNALHTRLEKGKTPECDVSSPEG
jgi:hypothetical protein